MSADEIARIMNAPKLATYGYSDSGGHNVTSSENSNAFTHIA